MEQNRDLPDHFQFFVQTEFFIGSDDRNIFGNSLSDDLTVKGIKVKERQPKELVSMLSCIRQDSQAQIRHAGNDLFFVDCNFPRACLIASSERAFDFRVLRCKAHIKIAGGGGSTWKSAFAMCIPLCGAS